MTDFSFANHGSIALLTPRSKAAKAWIDENVEQNDETQYWGTSICIEPRYCGAILEGIMEAGLTIGG